MKRPDEKLFLADMLDQARHAMASVNGRSRSDLESDLILEAALKRFLEVLGEAANRVSEATRVKMPGIPWRDIVSMRNRLIHAYATVDRNVVWEVVNVDLPALVPVLEQYLADHPS
jgi:uncharacterized protein with HEPN domain